MNRLDFRVGGKILNYFKRVGNVSFHTQGKRFKSLQEQKSVERGKGRARVAEKNCSYISRKRRRAYSVSKRNSVITRVRFGYPRVSAGFLPVKCAAVHDNAAYRRAVTADEFCCGMNNDVRAVFNGSYQIRGRKGGIDHKRKSVFVRYRRYALNVAYVRVRVAERFDIKRLCFGPDGFFESVKVVRVYKVGGDAGRKGQRMRKQVVCAAVYIF